MAYPQNWWVAYLPIVGWLLGTIIYGQSLMANDFMIQYYSTMVFSWSIVIWWWVLTIRSWFDFQWWLMIMPISDQTWWSTMWNDSLLTAGKSLLFSAKLTMHSNWTDWTSWLAVWSWDRGDASCVARVLALTSQDVLHSQGRKRESTSDLEVHHFWPHLCDVRWLTPVVDDSCIIKSNLVVPLII